jgi:hypothetical protein
MAQSYFKYTAKPRHDKAINTLLGILEGIAADKTVTTQEWELLAKWVDENQSLTDRHPYNEIIPVLIDAMTDGRISEEEHQDLIWLCNQLRSQEYYDQITADLQRLQAILAAIAADGVVSEAEVEKLSEWLEDHTDLRACWPFDEVDSLITSVMQDRKIDPEEQKMLLEFFQSFAPDDMQFDRPMPTKKTVQGIYAVAPEIVFGDRRFCFTGESSRATRAEMKTMAMDRGAKVVPSISPALNYLVVGTNGNPCWSYACYGRKIEKAMRLRQEGAQIIIVHESDFFDSIA